MALDIYRKSKYFGIIISTIIPTVIIRPNKCQSGDPPIPPQFVAILRCVLSRMAGSGQLNPELINLAFWEHLPDKFRAVKNYEGRKVISKRNVHYFNLFLFYKIFFNFFYIRSLSTMSRKVFFCVYFFFIDREKFSQLINTEFHLFIRTARILNKISRRNGRGNKKGLALRPRELDHPQEK